MNFKFRSTRNTRIERLWVEVGTQFARRWRAFFTRLGRLHRLDRKNPAHLWLLHRLFLDLLNEDCTEFQTEWNLHPVSGRTTSDQSPADMRFLGQTTEGVYTDPLDGIHPDAINRYLGVAGPRQHRSSNQTGAGHASDDDSDSDDEEQEQLLRTDEADIENRVGRDQAHNIRHAPIKVARHQSPFENIAQEEGFLDFLEDTFQQGDLPEDYGVQDHEWDEEDYPETEIIRPGTRGKEILVILPRDEWFPRAIQWAQALDTMNRVLSQLNDDW
ncbi:hypothetical protein B0H11DRAFT_1737159 [Mycena galericulata]|nr:hypothetical protein B0H11DRAFT_1737159 [Mycena galericulata]